ncbi:PREDICTED: uncharacterized protein LOC109173066 [Ipomoea nil]|uniref:uncharacterized protein LOC109173066 n=1 Tax=Ipomoea nil TaxID=35883 RepID=UPI000901F45C|nr:PREDICTED: uncharacterized protein LOC109173066 [Ipomoea nil]
MASSSQQQREVSEQYDEDALSDKWADMRLEDEEEGVEAANAFRPNDVDGGKVYSVVGRFLTRKMIKVEYMRQVLASAWQPVMGLRVTELHANLFLFAFYHETDMLRVLQDGSWSFENHTLVCRQVCDGSLPGEVKLDTVDMWVQVYDLPMGYTSNMILEQACNYVGTFIKCDDRQVGGPWKTFYRVRVAVPVDKPLKRRMKLIRRDKTWGWVNFKYERLHNFCYCCGMLGHLEKFCVKARVSGIKPELYPYGAWMRAGRTKGPRPVGASWLLPPVGDTPLPPKVQPGTGSPGVGGMADVHMVVSGDEVDEDVVASSKRRRAGTVDDDLTGATVPVSEEVVHDNVSKNLQMAGLGSQARPTQ